MKTIIGKLKDLQVILQVHSVFFVSDSFFSIVACCLILKFIYKLVMEYYSYWYTNMNKTIYIERDLAHTLHEITNIFVTVWIN